MDGNSELLRLRTGNQDQKAEITKSNQTGRNIRRSESEDNLFWKRYLNARFGNKILNNRAGSTIDALDEMKQKINAANISKENRKYVAQYASDVMKDEGEYSERDAKAIVGKEKVFQNEDEFIIRKISQDKYERDASGRWGEKYEEWYYNADLVEIVDNMATLASLGIDLQTVISGCSLRQQAIIAKYASQMLDHGYKQEFIKEVAKSMAILYTTEVIFPDLSKSSGLSIEKVLPKSLDPENRERDFSIVDPDIIHSSKYRIMRERISDLLKLITRTNGGDYRIIQEYCWNQQEKGSWCEEARQLKGFYLAQMEDENSDRYVFLPGGKHVDDNGKVTEWNHGAKSFVEHFYEKHPIDASGEYDRYFKTMAFQQGFMAIALNYIDNIPGLDDQKETLEVYRVSMNRFIPGQPQGKAESTALNDYAFSFKYKEGANKMKIRMPLSGIHFVYFLSREMCDETGNEHPRGEEKYSTEFEIIGDLSKNVQIQDETKPNIKGDIEIVGFDKEGGVELEIGGGIDSQTGDRFKGQKAHLLPPYKVLRVDQERKMVYLYDIYHFWDTKVNVVTNGKKYEGYTDDPRIVEIAERAARNEISDKNVGEVIPEMKGKYDNSIDPANFGHDVKQNI